MAFPSVLLLITSLAIATTQQQDFVKMVSRGNTYFTIGMYKELAKNQGNIFFSPICMHSVLSLLAQGANGRTLNEFLWVLGVEQATLSSGYHSLLKGLNKLTNITLHMANKVYIQERFKMKNDFASIATKNFLAETENIDFTKNAHKTINKWCEQKTKNKIKDVIKPGDLDSRTVMIILNAIYFKGMWEVPFAKSKTRNQSFFVSEKETISVDMMSNEDFYLTGFNIQLNSHILQLKYRNLDVSMVIILPKDTFGIEKLEKQLGTFDLTSLTEDLQMQYLTVSVPKFKIETDMHLDSVLTQMGITTAFTRESDLTKLVESTRKLQITKAFQKAFIEVSEEGTEAAAVGGVEISARSFRPSIYIDHPFLMIIQAKVKGTNNILFFGKVMRPSLH